MSEQNPCADFLEARIADDEALATAASVSMHGEVHEDERNWGDYVLSSDRDSTEDQDQFITTWWPRRVLAECAAKRKIIALAGSVESMDYQIQNEWGGDLDGTADDMLKALAAVYADHPDYRHEWAPDGTR